MRPLRSMAMLALALALTLLPACGDDGGGDDGGGGDADATPATDTTAGPDTTPTDTTPTDTGADGAVAADTAAGDTGWTPPAPALWPANELPPLAGPFLAAHPELAPWSRWLTHLDGSPEPNPAFRGRGAFGLGNGHVFALVGMADPANAIHTLAGPTYEQGEDFYGDVAVGVTGPDAGPDGPSWKDFDEQWVLGSFGAPALLWRGLRGDLELVTVDLTPWGDAPDVAQRAWLRTVLVRNHGDAPLADLTLEVRTWGAEAAADGASLVQEKERRRLVVFFDRDGAAADGRRLTLPLPAIAPGAEERVVLALLTMPAAADPDSERTALLAALDGGGLDDLFASSAAALQAWWDGLVQLETPDPMVDDLVRALALTQKYQLTASGATSPMSHYGGTWTRDNVGPLLSLLALGAHEDAAGVLDYYFRAVVVSGGLRNRYASDLPTDEPLPPEPDWASLGEGSERTAGEAPSYIPLMYRDYADWTGDLDKAVARIGFLRHTLDTQHVTDDGLITWSGDETFRAAMNAAMGLNIEYPLQFETWSTNSSLLYVAAADFLAEIEEAAGNGDAASGDAARWRASRDLVWQAALDRLRLADGCWSAYRFRDDFGGEPSPAPFEDVALKELWAGTTDGDDAEAQARLACLLDHVRQAPGVLQSPLHSRYAQTPIFPFVREGLYTGMLPGYTLNALTRAGHPEAGDAFDAVRLSADTSGNSTEYMVYDDHLPAHLLYVPQGTGATDYTARFRPWEGGIVLHAMLDHVVGVQPQRAGRPQRTARIIFRPHLPNGWPSFTARNVRVHDSRYDIEVTRIGPDGAVEVAIEAHGDETPFVAVRWDHAADRTFAVDGAFAVLDDAEPLVTRREHLGAASTELAGDTILPGGTRMTVRFTPRP